MKRAAPLLIVAGLTAAGAAQAQVQAPPIDRPALVDDLDARLLAGPTATGVLTAWCAEHRLAEPARIRAELVRSGVKLATAAQRTRLGVGTDEPLGYRRVRLWCGDRIFSEAENWYVPSRLTPQMRSQLDASDTPFGAVVAPLKPTRKNLETFRLWYPRNAQSPVGKHLFRHRALVIAGNGKVLAEVAETYLSGVLP